MALRYLCFSKVGYCKLLRAADRHVLVVGLGLMRTGCLASDPYYGELAYTQLTHTHTHTHTDNFHRFQFIEFPHYRRPRLVRALGVLYHPHICIPYETGSRRALVTEL
jgi:hypothetical protein